MQKNNPTREARGKQERVDVMETRAETKRKLSRRREYSTMSNEVQNNMKTLTTCN